jgi:hypothetical protein
MACRSRNIRAGSVLCSILSRDRGKRSSLRQDTRDLVYLLVILDKSE